MLAFLRFLGVLNAATWCGAGIFFTVAVGPAFFSQDMRQLLVNVHPAYAGAIAMVVLKRYFLLHYCCGGVALGLLIVDWLYTGRPWNRLHLGVLCILMSLGLAGGLWLQPKMKALYAVKHQAAAPAQREEAGKRFAMWHGVSQSMNLVMLAGMVFHLWRASQSQPGPRFGGDRRYRAA